MNLPIEFTPEILGIIEVTMRMSLASTVIGSVIGIALGLLLERVNFPGKLIVVRLCRTLMGTPPVVVGLVVFLLLMRRGPLGFFGWLFTVPGMIFAQVAIIIPIACGMTYSYAVRSAPQLRAFAKTMGANAMQTRLLMIKEMSGEMYFVVITAFGRAISEVGSVMIVGGNIQGNTRVMTTAITLMLNMGRFNEAITLGVMLIMISFLLQSLAGFFHKEREGGENF
ncbi:MAG: ABC transporter permease [Spirochaetes bacterium]|nr:ABC transporter permease [Spirochaetota bacterium]